MIGIGDVKLDVTVPPPVPVPTLDEWARLSLAGLLACMAVVYLRRRQR